MLYIQNALDEIGLVEYVPLSNIGGNPALGYLTNPRGDRPATALQADEIAREPLAPLL